MAKGEILEFIAHIAVAAHSKGSLRAGLGGGLPGADVLFVLCHGVHLRVETRHPHFYHGVFMGVGCVSLCRAVYSQHKVVIDGIALKIGVWRVVCHQLREFHSYLSPFW